MMDIYVKKAGIIDEDGTEYNQGEVLLVAKANIPPEDVRKLLEHLGLSGNVKDHSTLWSVIILDRIEEEDKLIKDLLREEIVDGACRVIKSYKKRKK